MRSNPCSAVPGAPYTGTRRHSHPRESARPDFPPTPANANAAQDSRDAQRKLVSGVNIKQAVLPAIAPPALASSSSTLIANFRSAALNVAVAPGYPGIPPRHTRSPGCTNSRATRSSASAPLKQSPPAPRHTSRPETCSDNRRLLPQWLVSHRIATTSRFIGPAAGAVATCAHNAVGNKSSAGILRGRLGSLGLRLTYAAFAYAEILPAVRASAPDLPFVRNSSNPSGKGRLTCVPRPDLLLSRSLDLSCSNCLDDRSPRQVVCRAKSRVAGRRVAGRSRPPNLQSVKPHTSQPCADLLQFPRGKPPRSKAVARFVMIMVQSEIL